MAGDGRHRREGDTYELNDEHMHERSTDISFAPASLLLLISVKQFSSCLSFSSVPSLSSTATNPRSPQSIPRSTHERTEAPVQSRGTSEGGEATVERPGPTTQTTTTTTTTELAPLRRMSLWPASLPELAIQGQIEEAQPVHEYRREIISSFESSVDQFPRRCAVF